MARSSGTYTAPSNSFNPAVEGAEIDEGDWNTLLDDIETALTESVYTSGLGSTDNALLRTDGTDTKKAQGSPVTLDDAGAMAGLISSEYTEAAAPSSPAANRIVLYCADDSGTTRLYAKDSAGTVYTVTLSPSGQLDTLSTTQGAIVYRNASAWVALGPGTAGQVLQSGGAGANPSWTAAGTGDVLGPASSVDGEIALFDSTTGKVLKRASATGLLKAASGVLSAASAGTDYYAPSGTDVAIADGGTGASTAAAGFRALAEGIGSTQGDILYRNATEWVALGAGSIGQVLQSGGAGGNPSWATVSGTGDVTAASSFGADNRIIRSDGTGKGVQASAVTIDDNGHITGAASVNGLAMRTNIGLTVSAAAGALTIALKGADGNDPSATNPVDIAFRSATSTTGTMTTRTITAATSLVVSSGSTLGVVSSTAFKLWVVAFDDAGTVRLGVINCFNSTGPVIHPLRPYMIASSTAEGGAGAADSAGVFYTGTAVSSKPLAVLGFLAWDASGVTAGTWTTTNLSRVQVYEPGVPLPGDTVQVVVHADGGYASGTTSIPFDDTIPQYTEGVLFMTASITPTLHANMLEVVSIGSYALSATGRGTAALFRDSGANALAAMSVYVDFSLNDQFALTLAWRGRASTTSSTSFQTRAGGSNAGTYSFNGAGAARLGGVSASNTTIREIAT